MSNKDNRFLAVSWMMAALCSFSLIAVGARELGGHVPIYQTLFARSVIGLLVVVLVAIATNQFAIYKTEKIKLHTFRNIFHFAGQYFWFIGIALLPLAEVFALEFTIPIWTVIIAGLFLQEKVTSRKIAAILLGLIGVAIIVKPSYGIMNSAALIVIASAIFFSVSHTCTKALSGTENTLTILFYMCLIQLPIGLVLCAAGWVTPSATNWLWIIVISLSALSAHFCMSKALIYADVITIVTLDFLRLPLIAAVGILLYNESFEASLILGAIIMLTGNLISAKAVK